MRIDPSSWHWRAFLGWEARQRQRRAYKRGRLDLCRYFWTVVLLAPWSWLVEPASGRRRWLWRIWFVYMGAVVVYLLILGVRAALEHGWWWLAVRLGVGALLVLAGVVVVLLLAATAYYLLVDKRGKEAIASSLPVQFLKAKKRKVCPLLEAPTYQRPRDPEVAGKET